MRFSEAYLERVASALISALEKKNLIRPGGEVKTARQRLAAALVANFREEDALEKEAERLAQEHARELRGADRRRVVQLIMQRLATQRGVVL